MEEEIKMLGKMRRIGGSLMVTVPANFVKQENFQEDDLVEITVKKRKVSGFGMLKGIGSFTREDRAKGQLEK